MTFDEQFRLVQDALKSDDEVTRTIARTALCKYAEFVSICGVLKESNVEDG